MENQQENNVFGSDWRKPLRNIKYLFAALVLILIAGLAWGGWYYSKHKTPDQHFVTTRDSGLTDSEKASYQAQIDELKIKLNASGISNDDKFKDLANIGQDYYMIGDLATAKGFDLQASALKPEVSFIWEQLYQVARAMQDYKSAEQYIQKAVDLSPGNVGYKAELDEVKALELVPR